MRTRAKRFTLRWAWVTVISLTLACSVASAGDSLSIGVAKIDITPPYPIRLAGYAARKTSSEGVEQHLFAKALAIQTGSSRALLITVDNCGVPGNVRDEVVRRLTRQNKIKSAQVAICSTHTHSAPLVGGYLVNLFYPPISSEEQDRVDQYTRELTDALQSVALDALADLKPALLKHGVGSAPFAANRRTPGGPVDHDLPVLLATSLDGKIRAILTSYACHCTTLTGEFNKICGDWAAYAQEYLEADHPGAIAMVAIGCGGDANPNPRPGFELAQQHGRSIANGVDTALKDLRPISGLLRCKDKLISLPYAPLPTLADWEKLSTQTNHIGQQARWYVDRLRRGEKLPTSLPYRVQAWTLGDDLAFVFLAGEVVVDYSKQLKREFRNVWVNAYANDVPCYIPSERVLKEGGYEGGGAMVYYNRPAKFAPGLENKIVTTVHKLVPKKFRSTP